MDHLHLLSPRLSPQRLARALGAFLLGLLLFALVPISHAETGTVTQSCQSATCSGAQYTVCVSGGWLREEAIIYGHLSELAAVGWGFVEYCGASTTTARYFRETPLASTGCEVGSSMDSNTRQCALPECPAGQVRNSITEQCQAPCPAAGTAGGGAYVSPFTVHPPSICRDGCSLNVGSGYHIPGSNGGIYGVSGLVNTGEFCAGEQGGSGSGNHPSYDEPGDEPPITVTPDDNPPICGPGQCPGSAGNPPVAMCVSCKDIATPEKPVTDYNKKTETTTTGTPPNQTTETTTTETKSTHDGSGTVTTTTTTSTTKTDGNGTTTSEEGKTEKKESQESFCKENPTSSFCKEGKWGGSCDNFTCEGDAVECALAREVHQRNCEASKGNTYTDMSDAAEAGTDTGATHINTEKEAQPLDVQARFAQNLDASPIAASCPSPRAVTLPGGHSLEISFEKPCEAAGMLGNFVQAFAYLFAALIVLRNPTA